MYMPMQMAAQVAASGAPPPQLSLVGSLPLQQQPAPGGQFGAPGAPSQQPQHQQHQPTQFTQQMQVWVMRERAAAVPHTQGFG